MGIDGKSAAAQLGWPKALVGEKKLNDAAVHFRKAAELDPNYRDVLLELAAEYEKAGQPEMRSRFTRSSQRMRRHRSAWANY